MRLQCVFDHCHLCQDVPPFRDEVTIAGPSEALRDMPEHTRREPPKQTYQFLLGGFRGEDEANRQSEQHADENSCHAVKAQRST